MAYSCGSQWIAFLDGDRLLIRPKYCERMTCPRCGPERANRAAERVRKHLGGQPAWIGEQYGKNKTFSRYAERSKIQYLAMFQQPRSPRLICASADTRGLCRVEADTAAAWVKRESLGARLSWSAGWPDGETRCEFLCQRPHAKLEAALEKLHSEKYGYRTGYDFHGFPDSGVLIAGLLGIWSE